MDLQLVILDIRTSAQQEDHRLIDACWGNHWEELESLLQGPQDPNTCRDEGEAALYIAANEGHVECVNLLLEAMADVHHMQATNSETAVHSAAFHSHLEVVKLLLEAGADKDAARPDGATALHFAAEHGNLELVHLMLEAGADRNMQMETWGGSMTALDWAAQGGHLDVARLLLGSAHEETCLRMCRSKTMLLAVQSWSVEIVRLLLDSGADKNFVMKDSGGWGALHHAAAYGALDMVRFLLDSNIEMNNGDDEGLTPLHLASRGNNTEVVRVLLDAGATPNAAMNDGATPLHLASRYKNTEVVRALLDAGATPNAAMDDGATPLHLAAASGKLTDVVVLLNAGAEKSRRKKDGLTALHVAIQNGHLAVRMLLGDICWGHQNCRGFLMVHQDIRQFHHCPGHFQTPKRLNKKVSESWRCGREEQTTCRVGHCTTFLLFCHWGMQMMMQKAAKEGDLPEVLRLFEMAPVTGVPGLKQRVFPP